MEGKPFIVGILFLLISSLYAEQFVLVSDLDDTLKITNGKNTKKMIQNAFFKTDTFLGMPMLYRQLERAGIYEAYLLSASPFIVKNNVNRLINRFDLNFKNIFLRGIRDLKDKRKYKLKRLREIIAQTKDQLILIGDDQDLDPEIYMSVKKEFPHRVKSIFIRKIQNRKLPKGVVGFITPLDIALSLKFFLGENNLKELYIKLSKVEKTEKIIPDFAYCPKNKWLNSKRYEYFVKKVNHFCKSRKQ